MRAEITSRDNAQVKAARALATSAARRAAEGAFFAEGVRLCLDLAKTLPVRQVFATAACLAAWPQAEALCETVFVVGEGVAQKLGGTKTPQGLFCLFETPRTEWGALNAQKGLLVCQHVQDPANVGTMVRTAAALDFGGVLLVGRCADAFGEKALRASMGAVGRVPLWQQADETAALHRLRDEGVALYAAALSATAQPYTRLVGAAPPLALLVGNEGAGLTPEALALANEVVYIPMANGVESLNAAAAAAVLMAATRLGQGDALPHKEDE